LNWLLAWLTLERLPVGGIHLLSLTPWLDRWRNRSLRPSKGWKTQRLAAAAAALLIFFADKQRLSSRPRDLTTLGTRPGQARFS
jgi:hypothetical protein